MEAHIAHLQDQVNMLFDNLNALRHHVDTNIGPMDASPLAQTTYAQPTPLSQTTPTQASPGHSRSRSLPRVSTFQGPTSAAYNIGVARSSLQTMGITTSDDVLEEDLTTQDASPTGSPSLANQVLGKIPLHSTKDQIWAITRAEAIRLCHLWDSEMGVMYPVVEIDRVVRHANLLYGFIEAVSRSGFVQLALPGADSIHDEQTIILKLIIASSLVLEGSGRSELGQRIFEQASPSVNEQMTKTPNILGIQILSLAVCSPFSILVEYQALTMVLGDVSLPPRCGEPGVAHRGNLCQNVYGARTTPPRNI